MWMRLEIRVNRDGLRSYAWMELRAGFRFEDDGGGSTLEAHLKTYKQLSKCCAGKGPSGAEALWKWLSMDRSPS